MLSLTGYRGFARLAARFEKLPEAADVEVRARVTATTELVYRQARENIMTMFDHPDRMVNALEMTVTAAGTGAYEGRVSIRGAGYAALERGSAPHWIFPVNARALAFEPPGGSVRDRTETTVVFTDDVFHPGTRAYHFLRSAIADKRAEIRASFADLTRGAWERTG